MAMTSISLMSLDPPRAEIVRMDDGRGFIALRLEDGLASLTLPGFDGETATWARALAAALMRAADEIEVTPAKPDIVFERNVFVATAPDDEAIF